MPAYLFAAIPNWHAEVDASAADYTCPSNTIAVRVNDIAAGSSVELQAGGVSVVYDNLEAGSVIEGNFDKILAAGTTCASVIVLALQR